MEWSQISSLCCNAIIANGIDLSKMGFIERWVAAVIIDATLCHYNDISPCSTWHFGICHYAVSGIRCDDVGAAIRPFTIRDLRKDLYEIGFAVERINDHGQFGLSVVCLTDGRLIVCQAINQQIVNQLFKEICFISNHTYK